MVQLLYGSLTMNDIALEIKFVKIRNNTEKMLITYEYTVLNDKSRIQNILCILLQLCKSNHIKDWKDKNQRW